MLRKKILTLLISCILLFAISQPSLAGERWFWLSTTSSGSCYFDTKTVQLVEEEDYSYLDVWIRCDLTPEGAKSFVKDLNSRGYYDRKLKKIGFVLTHYYFSFPSLYKKSLSWTAYDQKGNTLTYDGAPLGEKNLLAQWEPIVPGTDKELWVEIINSRQSVHHRSE